MYLELLNEKIFYYFENTGKQKILFLHGFNSNILFINHIKNLKRNYDIISFDYPGCGKSSTNSKLTIEFYGQITMEFIKKLKLDNLIVVAHSLGATSAIYIHNLKQVKKIILLAPLNPFAVDENNREKIIKMLLPNSEQEALNSLELLVQNKNLEIYWKNIEKNSKLFLKQISLKYSTFEFLVKNQIANPNYLNTNLKNIYLQYKQSKKLIIIIGSKDYFISFESASKIANVLNIELILFKNIGHALLYECSNEINDLLNKIL